MRDCFILFATIPPPPITFPRNDQLANHQDETASCFTNNLGEYYPRTNCFAVRANAVERNKGDKRVVLQRYSRYDHRPVFSRSGQGRGDRDAFLLPAGNF